jgi:hypothetical protein
VTEYTRLIQGFNFEHTWLAGTDGRELDTNDTDLSVTFALPVFPNPKHPLLVSPGMTLSLWAGPAEPNSITPDGTADLPPRAYGAYLDFTWRPQFTQILGAELAVRPGVYSDFEAVNIDSIRIQGRGLLFLNLTPHLQLAIGAAYLDRVNIKMLPAGGLIWTPNDHARYEIIFPRPKLAHYWFTSFANTEWWAYLAGEYGGGSWTIERISGADDQIDLNDFRVMGGLEFRPAPAIDGGARPLLRKSVVYFEAGYVFDRKIVYSRGMPDEFGLPDTFMVRGGIGY